MSAIAPGESCYQWLCRLLNREKRGVTLQPCVQIDFFDPVALTATRIITRSAFRATTRCAIIGTERGSAELRVVDGYEAPIRIY